MSQDSTNKLLFIHLAQVNQMKGSCCWPRFKKFALIILPFPRFLNDENAADYVDAIACGFCKTNLTKGKEIEVEDWYLLSH